MDEGGEKPKSSMKWIVGIVIGVVIIAVGILIAFDILNPIANPPKPDITLLDGHDGFQGLNYVVYIDVGVKNNGAEGWITVYAELESTGRYEEKSSRVYMASGETKQLQFVYDVGFWNTALSSMTYRARAVAG